MASLKPLEEVNMRKLFVTAAAVAMLLSTGALTTRSDAMTLALRPAFALRSTPPVCVKHVRWSDRRSVESLAITGILDADHRHPELPLARSLAAGDQ
jgi:hypothetical protein